MTQRVPRRLFRLAVGVPLKAALRQLFGSCLSSSPGPE